MSYPLSWKRLFEHVTPVAPDTLRWWLADRLDCGLTVLPMDAVPTSGDRADFEAAVARLASGEPVQYVCGRCPFHEIVVSVDNRVLIPRPETEELVELALRHAIQPGSRVLDVGTGSGCIALALKKARPDCHVEGIDISEDALEVARSNASRLGLEVDFRVGDLLTSEADGAWDVIVANLPYVGEDERAQVDPCVLDFEPSLALFAGPDGTDLVLKLIDQARRVLAKRGRIVLETGGAQGHIYAPAAARLGWSLRGFSDVAGKPRFWILERHDV